LQQEILKILLNCLQTVRDHHSSLYMWWRHNRYYLPYTI